MKKLRLQTHFLFVICLFFMISVTLPALADMPIKGGQLVIGHAETLRHFNGAVQSGTNTGLPSTQIFASPLRYDDQWNPHPYLAEKWEVSEDGLSVTLFLVKNAFFHDGQPITSEDVAFSIKVIKENHPFTPMLAPVTEVETPDDHTAIIRLSQPHPALLLSMSPALMPILPKHIYDTEGDIKSHPANLKPIGSGPFKLVEYVPGEHYILEKFDKFFIPERPYLDRIVVRIFSDINNEVLSLERGDLDYIPFLGDTRSVDRLSKLKGMTVTNKGFEGIGPLHWLAFNTTKAPLDDVRVRQAIAYATDREFVVNKLMSGYATAAYGPITPFSPFAANDLEKYTLNLDKAKELLDEAGLKRGPDGIRCRMVIDYEPGISLQRNLAEYFRAQLKKVDIDLTVRSAPDFPTWAQRVSNYDFDMTIDAVFNWGDPVIGVARTYLSSNIRKGVIWTNTQQYVNPKVDELLNQAAIELEPSNRISLYKEFQHTVVNDVPIYFINVIPYYSAYSDRIGNPPSTIWGALSPMDEVYLKK